MSLVLEAAESRQVTFGTDERVLKGRPLYQYIHLVLDDFEATSTAGFHARSNNNMELSCFPILPFYCCVIPDCQEAGGIRHGLSVRRPYVRCFRKIEDIRQQRCVTERSMADTP